MSAARCAPAHAIRTVWAVDARVPPLQPTCNTMPGRPRRAAISFTDNMAEIPTTASTWFAELRRRRIFRALAAYLVGAWVLLQIASVTFPPLGLPEWWQRALIIALAVGVAPVSVLAWLYDFTAHGVVRTSALRPDDADALPASSAAARVEAPPATAALGADPAAGCDAASCAVENGASSPSAASVAILPFADLSPGKDQDWFCDGLAEEIIDALCCVRGLRVASRTASFRYRDGSVDPREIGSQLRVGAILEGSVRKAGERLRITAQLIDTRSGYHLWSETWDRRLEDVFAIQTEIARKVSAALRVSLTGDVLAARERHAPRDLRAHEFYLRGRQLVGRVSKEDWLQAPALFRRAIELDPEYAQAHAGLADLFGQAVDGVRVPVRLGGHALDVLEVAGQLIHGRPGHADRIGRQARPRRGAARNRTAAGPRGGTCPRTRFVGPVLVGVMIVRAGDGRANERSGRHHGLDGWSGGGFHRCFARHLAAGPTAVKLRGAEGRLLRGPGSRRLGRGPPFSPSGRDVHRADGGGGQQESRDEHKRRAHE